MNNVFLYPKVISNIKTICRRHLVGEATLDEFQESIRNGEALIVALEERDIADYFTDIEGKIELVKFTVDDNRQIYESRKIAEDVLRWLGARAKTT